MSDKRTFKPGGLITALFGVSRGVTKADWTSDAGGIVVKIQRWNGTNWEDKSPEENVTAFAGLPFADTITAGTYVWMFYLYKTYFVVLVSC